MHTLPDPVQRWLQQLAAQVTLPPDAARSLQDALRESATGIPTRGAVSETRLDRYTVMESLGEGSTGAVYRAYDPELQRFIALKVIHQWRLVDDNALKRFIHEARTTARLQHPSIVPVHEIGRLQDGRIFFTMQQVRGRTLAEALHLLHAAGDEGPTQRDLILVLQRVAEAIAFAHSNDVIHRDLKPDNVMLGDFGEVYILDWGIAQLIGDERPEGWSPHGGTPDYMAPEQAIGPTLPIGPAADIYALGSILFEIFIGRPPILGLADIARHSAESSDGDGIPKGLEDLLRRTLSPDPRTRYTDAAEVLKALRQWLEQQALWAQSTALISDASDLAEDASALQAEASKRQVAAQRALDALPPWAPDDARAVAWEQLDEASMLGQRAETLMVERAHLLRLAQYASPANRAIQHQLATLYQRLHAAAESRGDTDTVSHTELMLRRYDRGQYTAYLDGEGSLTLHATHPITARLLRIREHRRLRLPEDTGVTLTLPITDHPLPMGRYVLELSAEGRASARYPLQIDRGQAWDSTPPDQQEPAPLSLTDAFDCPEASAVIPAGWFWAGGDPSAPGSTPVAQRLWVPDFAIMHTPVTNEAYASFLQSVSPAERSQWLPNPLRGGRLGRDGALIEAHDATLPVVGVTWRAAQAYARWRRERDSLDWRLPEEWEWEKAARGVDQRSYPWGDHFTAPRCNMRRSTAGAPRLAPVSAHPTDRSVYGVCGLAGGVSEWTGTPAGHTPAAGTCVRSSEPLQVSTVVIRGGSWLAGADGCRLARRGIAIAEQASPEIGFRLVCALS